MTDMPKKTRDPNEDRSSSGNGEDAGAQPNSKWEWLIAALGALILAATIAYLAYLGLAGPQAPPDIELQRISVQPVGNGYLVRLRAVNRGGATAASVHVAVKLSDARGNIVEKSEAVFDYIPEKGQRQGGVFFTHDPSRYKLELRAEGYVEP